MIADLEANAAIDEKVWLNTRAIFHGETSSDIFRSDRPLADQFFKERAPGNRSSKSRPKVYFFVHSSRLWALALVAIGISAVSAFLAVKDRHRPDQPAETAVQIEELTSSVAALKASIGAISADQTQWVKRGEVEASQAGVRQTLGRLFDRLDRERDDAKVRDAGMELRLKGLEVDEAATAKDLAVIQTSSTYQTLSGETLQGQSKLSSNSTTKATVEGLRERVSVPLGELVPQKIAKLRKKLTIRQRRHSEANEHPLKAFEKVH